jgi:hypothetical protein
MTYLSELFTGLDWHLLEPLPDLMLMRPGSLFPQYTITSAVSWRGDLAIFYLPDNDRVEFNLDRLMGGVGARWFNPRTAVWSEAKYSGSKNRAVFFTPGPGDWLLVLCK